MQYLLLIYSNESDDAQRTPEQVAAHMDAYRTFTEDIVAQGLMRGGEALHSVNTATSVRVRQGRTMTTDGPFAETSEQLGGFYLIDCDDLDAAIGIASRIPTAQNGTVEIRPIMLLTADGQPA